MAYGLLLFYLLALVSRILELTIPQLRVPMFTLICICVALLLAGQETLRVVSTREFLLLSAFTVWLGVTAVTGIWWTGSLKSLISAVMTLAVVLAIMVFIDSPERLKTTMKVMAFAILIAALQSFAFVRGGNGRLELEAGTFHDPNEYAIILVIGIPLWLLILVSTRHALLKFFAVASILIIFRTALRTGSRGALIASGVLALLLLVKLPPYQRIAAAVLMPILLAGVYLALPAYLKARYMTLVTSDVQTSDEQIREQVMGGDESSTASRLQLLVNSLKITRDHPIFGVGANNFATENFNRTEKETGQKIWLVSHNSYTQVSSETGLPGFVLFVTILTLAVGNTRKVLKAAKSSHPPAPVLVDCARYLNLTLLTLCAGAFFLSIAYDSTIYVLYALSAVVGRLYAEQVAQSGHPAAPLEARSPVAMPAALSLNPTSRGAF